MRTIRVAARTALSADAAFDRISGLGNEWTVPFRGKSIHWRQQCETAPGKRRLSFTQTAGDFRNMSGAWQTTPTPEGCEVLLELTYDIGVPIYDRILDSLVERALADFVRMTVSRW
ncbi:SRPBCC family protein [Micromonospora sp. NPDC051196]|uniref:SRPBCC family protein n=1 Tax=Micromonospora sp. NPDC051196 TaxID=3155281 RepID=UPI00343333BF